MLTFLVQLGTAISTGLIAFLVYRWTRKAEQYEVTRLTQSDWREYNLAVIADEGLQAIEATNHLHPDLSNAEVKKMCIYFIKLNVPYNLWLANRSGIVGSELMNSEIQVQAKLLFDDRKFVEQNVFPRGYANEFCAIFRQI